MSVVFTTSIDGLSSLKKFQLLLSPQTFDKAQKSAIRYAANSVPTTVAKGIGAAYNIKAARIKQDISRVIIQGNTATIIFSRTPPNLIQYAGKPGTRGHQSAAGRGLGWAKPSPRGKPATAITLRSLGRKPVAGAFVINAPTKDGSFNQVFVRRKSSGKLEGVTGPSIGSIFLGDSKIAQQLQLTTQSRINEQFQKGFQRAIDSAAKGYGAGV